MEIPHYLEDEQAERIGNAIAEDLNLERSREYRDRWQVGNDTFTNKGLARRMMNFVINNL